jgi:radical SAM/Cys-rich protein
MPCYSEQNVDKQRGKGVFEESINGLLKLNAHGYGDAGTGLILDLVYNPDEAVLPPSQVELEQDYKRELLENYGIKFNQLFVLANMPISRFGARLLARNQYLPYMSLLRDAFQESNLNSVMCRNLISVDYRGYLYDCDFNQMLDLPLKGIDKDRPHLADLVALDVNADLSAAHVAVGEHCYGCTAGQGSSCGGALVNLA